MNEKTQVPTNRYKNTPLASHILEMARRQEPRMRNFVTDNWFSSIRISGSRMNDHETFAEAGAAGCVYELHDENLFTVEQVVSLMDTFERVMRIEGLNHSHYQFSIYIEGPDGKWLPPVNGVPLDRILNVINLCSIFHEELAKDDKKISSNQSWTESTIDTLLQITLVDEKEGGFPELRDSEAFAKLLDAWQECQREIGKHYAD